MIKSNDYLFFALTNEIEQLKSRATGSKFDAITIRTFDEIKIPVPPPDVQAQIVAECQAIDDEAAQAEEQLSQIIQTIKEKTQTRFSQGCEDTLGNLVYINRESIDPTQYPDKDFVYVDISNVDKETGIIDFSQVIKGKDAPSRARRVAPNGSVIVSTVRPNLKGFAFVDRDTADCVFSTGFAVLESKDEGVIKNKALFYVFMYLDDLMRQMTDRMSKAAYPSVNQSDIANLKIRVPDASIQVSLIQEVSELEDQLQSARSIITSAAARRQAVLQKYLQSA